MASSRNSVIERVVLLKMLLVGDEMRNWLIAEATPMELKDYAHQTN